MRSMLACAIVLCSATAFAQSAPPPTVGGQPLVQVKPKESPKQTPKQSPKVAGKPQSIAVRLQACQEIDDGTKERLDCYDAVLAPAPKPKPAAAKTVMECKFVKEEDARLGCYNGFVDSMPKLPKS